MPIIQSIYKAKALYIIYNSDSSSINPLWSSVLNKGHLTKILI